MIAVYIRISSHSQKKDSQKRETKMWLDREGYQPHQVLWFEDQETSTTLKRPAFQKLQEATLRGEVKTVLFWRLDRLVRTIREGVILLADWCERDVRVISVTEPIDLSATVGHLLAAVLLGIAQIELQNIKERQAAGIAAAQEKGVYTGRKKGSFKANPKRIQELKAKGLTAREISHALNISPRSVFRHLASQI